MAFDAKGRSTNSVTGKAEACKTSDATDFFNLTAFEVEPYIPSVDEEGNPYLKEAALANAEINHYRNQYKDAPLVRMPIDRYAALTSANPDALKNLESRLLIVDPECNELKLFFGNLIGASELSLKNYLQMFDAAERLGHMASPLILSPSKAIVFPLMVASVSIQSFIGSSLKFLKTSKLRRRF